MQKPLLTIAILSHNHENFIEKAINGVLSQKCNFSFELLLFDDASSDSTPKIISDFEKLYNKFIRRHKIELGDFFINQTKDILEYLYADFEKHIKEDLKYY